MKSIYLQAIEEELQLHSRRGRRGLEDSYLLPNDESGSERAHMNVKLYEYRYTLLYFERLEFTAYRS